jgi:hypothetical protein
VVVLESSKLSCCQWLSMQADSSILNIIRQSKPNITVRGRTLYIADTTIVYSTWSCQHNWYSMLEVGQAYPGCARPGSFQSSGDAVDEHEAQNTGPNKCRPKSLVQDGQPANEPRDVCGSPGHMGIKIRAQIRARIPLTT